ncbi:hypothetical protein TNIN_88691 [Trichonephila inaurata madagascariensis]|uniref:Uncharacterized protein n=1 Tax=Trichonephila inaurata madagascariensis TaxID=2747483 RepID=A0A8X6XUK2_9ARAC|nr:hypothetical protein TNIN_88691 [Trichonephila inaurata madagascariensis]
MGQSLCPTITSRSGGVAREDQKLICCRYKKNVGAMNGENAAEAVQVYWRIHKLEAYIPYELYCKCDRPQFEGPSVPVEVVKLHHSITADPLHTVFNSDVTEITVNKLLHSILWMFPYRFQCVQMMQSREE